MSRSIVSNQRSSPGGEVPGERKAPTLLMRLRQAIRQRHYSRRTEETYVGWVKRFVAFHGRRHPAELGAAEVSSFLSHLASDRHVSASTQNQALSALLFLYRAVLARDLGELPGLVYAKRSRRLPVVLTRDEVRAVLGRFSGPKWLWPHCSTEVGFGCWKVCGSESRMWTLPANSSSFEAARVTETG